MKILCAGELTTAAALKDQKMVTSPSVSLQSSQIYVGKLALQYHAAEKMMDCLLILLPYETFHGSDFSNLRLKLFNKIQLKYLKSKEITTQHPNLQKRSNFKPSTKLN